MAGEGGDGSGGGGGSGGGSDAGEDRVVNVLICGVGGQGVERESAHQAHQSEGVDPCRGAKGDAEASRQGALHRNASDP